MRQKRLLALRIGIAAFCTCMILLFFGKWIFEAFDITLDAFRIGGGALLFLSAVGLVNGKVEDKKPLAVEDDSEARISDIAVVPLAIPVTVGPGTIAALLVIGADAWIGSNATILPGVTIGEAAVVAAASVVTKDVPPRTVVVGAPARPVRTIEPEVSPPGGG